MLEAVPVHYFVFDVLVDREPVFSLPWRQRRARLEHIFEVSRPACASVLDVTPLDPTRPVDEQLSLAYEASRARGHEGIVLKRVDAPYEAGRRGGAWRKVKRAFATLDVVITVAERGHGRRANVLSDYTFAVKHEGELLDVGKAYSGLTDAEIAGMTERLEALTIERRGSRQRVKPAVVLEVAFDGIQRSKRHPSGFALRFPRINRIRDDKTVDEVDDLATVARLFESQVASGHREDPKTKPKRSKRGPQLGLFGVEVSDDDDGR
jgi:DNA ligase 1